MLLSPHLGRPSVGLPFNFFSNRQPSAGESCGRRSIWRVHGSDAFVILVDLFGEVVGEGLVEVEETLEVSPKGIAEACAAP